MHISTVLRQQPHKMVTTKPTIADNRREWLRLLVRQHNNSPGDLAAALGYSNGSFIVQMAGPNPTRQVTEKTARKIEQALKLEFGILDTPPPHQAPTRVVEVPQSALRPAGAPAPMVGADTPLIADVVRLVGQVAEAEHVALPPAKLADVVALAWSDTLEHGSQPREDYVRQLIKLVK